MVGEGVVKFMVVVLVIVVIGIWVIVGGVIFWCIRGLNKR